MLHEGRDRMIGYLFRWIVTLAIAFFAGKLISKIKMPSILGWLIVGMLLGPPCYRGNDTAGYGCGLV